MTTEWYHEEHAFFFEVVADAADSISVLYESERLLCDDSECAAILDGRPAYYDGIHFAHSPWRRWLAVLKATEREAGAR